MFAHLWEHEVGNDANWLLLASLDKVKTEKSTFRDKTSLTPAQGF